VRVLHVHSGNLFGGVESMLIVLARNRELVPQMEPHFALSYGGKLRDRLLEAGASVKTLGEVRVRNPLSIRRGRRNLAAIIRSVRPDVVLFHSSWAQALFGAVVQRMGVRFATWVHDLTDGRHWLERWAATVRPALILTSSEFIAAPLRQRAGTIRVEAIHCPVEVPADRRRDPHEGPVTIVQVGRLEEWKGHEVLLRALGSLQDVTRWRCQIVGGPQRAHEQAYLSRLQSLAEQLGIAARVEFLGHRHDVAEILAGADIYCQPNTAPEPFGIAIIEAMLSRLPVVTSAIGGAMEILDPRSGVLTPPGDVEAVAGALRELIDSPVARSSAGRYGHDRALQLTDPLQQMTRLAAVLSLPPEEQR
jgi:glycosyltransferase involved in cell wall biosynthesis